MNRNRLNLFPKSIIVPKRQQIKRIIGGLAEGNKLILQEYLKERSVIFQECKNKLEEYEQIDEDKFWKYMLITYDATANQVDSLTRDKAKLAYFLQLQEQKRNQLLNTNMS